MPFNYPFPVALDPVIGLSQQDFLDMLDRLLPFEYLSPLKSPGPGYEIYQFEAAIGARVSTAIARFEAASFIVSAPDGGYAQATVAFSRPTAAAGAVTVKAGTVVETTLFGRQFVLLADVPFGATDLVQFGTVQAVHQGEQWNVKGPYYTAGGELVPGEISTIVTWVQSPPFGDASITVAQAVDAVGGLSSVLNLHGADRGFTRNPNEPATVFRQRVRTLPDTVSPGAIQRVLAQYQATYGGTWDFVETFSGSFQEAFDCPSPNPGVPNYSTSIPSSINTNLFVYDDPRPPYPPFRNRWLDITNYRGAFIVTVPVLPAIADLGMAYDDTAEIPAGTLTVNGARAVSAYDVPASLASELQGAYDGVDYAKNAVFVGLYQTLQKIKAAGVLVDIELQGQ